ncbi:MAG: hypothetical protein H7246_00705 [Phycisphaerae bacterium]|nr:hypothetical protein [Saprospiraceae bacterium]
MTTTHIPTPKEIVALLAQNGVLALDKDAFVKAFKTLYPKLSTTERAELLADLLVYVDTVLESETLPTAA